MKNNYITSLIDNLIDFILISSEWNILLENSAETNPFLSHQWLQTWWEEYGRGTLHIITCRDADTKELVGILPLFRFQKGMLPSVTILRFLGCEQVSSDFLCCLAQKGLEHDVYTACLEALQRDVRLWDMVELKDMDEASSFCRYLSGVTIAELEVVQNSGQLCPFLNLPDSWEALLNKLSTKMRQRVGYYRRALGREGTVSLEQVTDSADIEGALEDMMRLRRDRMDQKGIAIAKVMDSFKRFHGALMSRFLDCGRLRLFFLCLNGQRISYLYLYTGVDRIYFYQTGFDRSWSKQSVGLVLLSMVIERAINEGFATFEFLRGQEAYKYDWTANERRLADFIIYRKSLKIFMYRIEKSCFRVAKNFSRKVLPKGTYDKFKKVSGLRFDDTM